MGSGNSAFAEVMLIQQALMRVAHPRVTQLIRLIDPGAGAATNPQVDLI